MYILLICNAVMYEFFIIVCAHCAAAEGAHETPA